ncbi:MAG: response regulator transcription factor [Chloroflexi bacterium]|nr:response regulator transcription factor [Chloroflexota bacterium]
MTQPNQIRILIADDQRLMLDGLRTLLELEPDLTVVGDVEDGQSGVDAYEKHKPEVVLIDIRMPGMDGVEATRQICAKWSGAKVIILTTFDDDYYVYEGVRAGASGYLLKAIKGAELAAAIRTVVAGGSFMEPTVAHKLMSEFARIADPGRSSNRDLAQPLSDRELEILGHLGRGLTNPEIAAHMHLAEGTVKNYVTNVLNKLGVRDRTQAALRARDLGVLKDT